MAALARAPSTLVPLPTIGLELLPRAVVLLDQVDHILLTGGKFGFRSERPQCAQCHIGVRHGSNLGPALDHPEVERCAARCHSWGGQGAERRGGSSRRAADT